MPDGLLFEIKRGDLTPAFRAQCLSNVDGVTPLDLTAVTTVKFIMRSRSSAVPKVSAAATKEDQITARGWIHYTWAAGDTDTLGDYRAEVEVTWPDGKTQTFPADGWAIVSVVADLG